MRTILDQILKRFVVLGRLTIRWPDGQLSTYTGEPGPEALLELRTERTVRRIALNPALAAGECYMDGSLVPVDGSIYDVLDLLVTTLTSRTSSNPIMQLRSAIARLTRRFAQFNPGWRARRNVS